MKDDELAFYMEVAQLVAGFAACAATVIGVLCYFDCPFISFIR